VVAEIVPSSGIETWKSDAVDLVDQEYRRFCAADRRQQRPFQQIFFRKNLVLDGVGVLAAMRLDREQLPLVIPFIERGRLIQPLIALQADQFGRMHRRQRLRHLGLADARFAFQQQRTPQQLHQRDRGRKLSVGDVAGFSQSLRDLLAVFHFSIPVIPGWSEGPDPESRDSPMCNCTS
jgi:hypothetical protein